MALERKRAGRPFGLAVGLCLAGCLAEPRLTFDNPCDPATGGKGCESGGDDGADQSSTDLTVPDSDGGAADLDSGATARDQGGSALDLGARDRDLADNGLATDLGPVETDSGQIGPDRGGLDLALDGGTADARLDLGPPRDAEGVLLDGAPMCMPDGPERCGNAIDDDCDGRVDEAVGGAVEGQPCRVGLGTCVRAGDYICSPDGILRCSTSPGPSRTERCDGQDDDCDGRVDEDERELRTGIDWVCIDGGSFQMGSPEGVGQADERPQRMVTVPTFRLARTEVTVAQFGACVAEGACPVPIAEVGCNWGVPGRAESALNCVSWNDAQDYALWVGGGARLPTESEWEYSARSGGADQVFPWGDAPVTCARAVLRDDGDPNCGLSGPRPPCSQPDGNSAQGLCDLAGNVWEWVEDWYGAYPLAPIDGGARSESGEVRVVRGGGWASSAAEMRAAVRDWWPPDLRYSRVGFRLARPDAQ